MAGVYEESSWLTLVVRGEVILFLIIIMIEHSILLLALALASTTSIEK